jgi:hypothetical protein
MKHFILILLTIGCAVVLFLGNQQWKEKVQVKSYSLTSSSIKEANGEQAQETQGSHSDQLLQLTAKWPAAAQKNFQAALEEGQPYKIVIAGSPALGTETVGWAAIVQQELIKVFGETISVVVKIHDLTSQEYITQEKHEELASEQADLLLLEPFILKNNGKVGNDLAAEHYSQIVATIKEANQEAVVILQPANPLSLAKYYPLQVEALQEYAEANNLSYIDHWQAWPDTENERKELLDIGDPSYPNERGHQLWADYLISYFISK